VSGAGALSVVPKVPTGIDGLDEITGGGLPQGRPTLVYGYAGCGKTLLAVEFLVNGAQKYGEPGVLMAFEETEADLAANVAALGFDLADLVRRKKLVVDYVQVERSEFDETGEYDLEGLFIRLGFAIDSIGAKRVALDTLEVLFGGLTNAALVRAELRRLFQWLKARGVTVVLTGERGAGALSRHGLEEYVSDCVILLDHRVVDQIATRRLRIVKYRGSPHGTNEYPFIIDDHGISVVPITSVGLEHIASHKRISTGILELDELLGGKGYFVGASVMVSGTAGSGKSSLAAHFVAAAAARGEHALYVAFEESQSQITRNMRSIGLDLEKPVRAGLIRFHAVRPTFHSLETHLATIQRAIEAHQPQVVVIDPITNLLNVGNSHEVRSVLTRLIDYLKLRNITALFTSLTPAGENQNYSTSAISSLIDTWIVLRDIEANGERNRALYLVKSRGMAHTNQVREFRLTDHGVELIEAYLGAGQVLTGSARAAQEAREHAERLLRQQDIARQTRELEAKQQGLEAQIAALRIQLEVGREEMARLIREEKAREKVLTDERTSMTKRRSGSVAAQPRSGRERRHGR
jgi:circadian clock protein KaiC